jgi:hypothetical protein
MDKSITISGILVPFRWDSDSRIVEVSLNAEDENVYEIQADEKGKLLEQNIQNRVQITGILLDSEPGKRTIKVSDFTVLPWLSFTD